MKTIPDNTIVESGTTPAQNAWPTVVVPAPGVYPPVSWSQATWFVDPANVTGVANDSNNGLTASTPVLSYNGGILAKWGTASPHLSQETTLTWLSSQSGSGDPVIFTPVIQNAVIYILGVLGTAQKSHSGTFASVVSKNIGMEQLLQADLGFSAAPGILLQNTTSGKESTASVYKNISGSTFAISQPLTPVALPLLASATPDEVDTWADGDSFVAWTPVSINIVLLGCTVAEFVAPDYPAQIQVKNVHFACAGAPGNDDVAIRNDVNVIDCSFDSILTDTAATDNEPTFYTNCFFGYGTCNTTGNNIFTNMLGGALIASGDVSFASWNFDGDVILDAPAGLTIGSFMTTYPFYTESLGDAYIDGTIEIIGHLHVSSGDGVVIWGPGVLNVNGSGRMNYDNAVGAAVATFKNSGGLQLNGQTTSSRFDPATGVWAAAVSLTPAALDTSFASGGLGGLGINVGGASISNQGYP